MKMPDSLLNQSKEGDRKKVITHSPYTQKGDSVPLDPCQKLGGIERDSAPFVR